MKTHYEHQLNYSCAPPDLTPRKILFLTPENVSEYKFLQEIRNSFRDDRGVMCGFTGADEDCLIIYKFDK